MSEAPLAPLVCASPQFTFGTYPCYPSCQNSDRSLQLNHDIPRWKKTRFTFENHLQKSRLRHRGKCIQPQPQLFACYETLVAINPRPEAALSRANIVAIPLALYEVALQLCRNTRILLEDLKGADLRHGSARARRSQRRGCCLDSETPMLATEDSTWWHGDMNGCASKSVPLMQTKATRTSRQLSLSRVRVRARAFARLHVHACANEVCSAPCLGLRCGSLHLSNGPTPGHSRQMPRRLVREWSMTRALSSLVGVRIGSVPVRWVSTTRILQQHAAHLCRSAGPSDVVSTIPRKRDEMASAGRVFAAARACLSGQVLQRRGAVSVVLWATQSNMPRTPLQPGLGRPCPCTDFVSDAPEQVLRDLLCAMADFARREGVCSHTSLPHPGQHTRPPPVWRPDAPALR